jgi:hypothetical protein
MRFSKLSLAVLFFLAACGGGGGDGDTSPSGATKTPLAISGSNYVAVATESVSAVSYVMDTSDIFTGATVSSDRLLLDFARAQALKMPGRFAAAAPMPSGTVINEVEACSGGGELRIALNDVNNNQDLDPGESLTIVAAQCVEFDSKFNGTMAVQLVGMTGDPAGDVYSMNVTITLTDLSVTMPGGSESGNGSMAMAISMTAPNTGEMALTFDSLTTSGSLAGASYSRTMWDFKLRDTYAIVNNVARDSLTVSGVLGSSELDSKAVTLSTLAPMVRLGLDEYPSSGQILATGAASSKMRLTAMNAATVLIEVDADGNGSFETSVTRPWSDLM